MIKDGLNISQNGNKDWFLNGELHRTDGPAIEDSEGYKAWYLKGLRHRTDGPAIEDSEGAKTWYLNGKKLSSEEINLLKVITQGPIEDLPLYITYPVFKDLIKERMAG